MYIKVLGRLVRHCNGDTEGYRIQIDNGNQKDIYGDKPVSELIRAIEIPRNTSNVIVVRNGAKKYLRLPHGEGPLREILWSPPTAPKLVQDRVVRSSREMKAVVQNTSFERFKRIYLGVQAELGDGFKVFEYRHNDKTGKWSFRVNGCGKVVDVVLATNLDQFAARGKDNGRLERGEATIGDLRGFISEITASVKRLFGSHSGGNDPDGHRPNGKDHGNTDSLDGLSSLGELTQYAREVLGAKQVDLTCLDPAAVKGTFIEIEKTINEFPVLAGKIAEFGKTNIGSMSTTFFGKVSFNPKSYDNVKTRAEAYAEAVQRGYFPQNTSWESTGAHEMGHILNVELIKASVPKDKWTIDWSSGTTAARIVNLALKSVNITDENTILRGMRILYEDEIAQYSHDEILGIYGFHSDESKHDVIISSLSGYASDDEGECFAEAIRDYISNGDKAHLLSLRIVEIVKGELGMERTESDMPRFVAEGYAQYREEFTVLTDGRKLRKKGGLKDIVGVVDGAPRWAYEEYDEWMRVRTEAKRELTRL